MATFFDQLFNQGKLPDINVEVQLDNASVVRLGVMIMIVMLLTILLYVVIRKKAGV
ncbi:MAG: hypothetical protein KGZ81_12215 [Flavobacteriales bacterium]|nr:hypothetical protein [Flavobacteriales bacterium]